MKKHNSKIYFMKTQQSILHDDYEKHKPQQAQPLRILENMEIPYSQQNKQFPLNDMRYRHLYCSNSS